MSTAFRWDEERTAGWLASVDAHEAELAPVSDALFAAADPAPGERVLDVGCGPGSTTRRAAVAVGPTGRVTGTDISPGMLTAAAGIPLPAGQHRSAAPVDWVAGDTAELDLGVGGFDLVLSRFGVMFYLDPVTAFARLARATAPTGRLAVAVWQRREKAEMFGLPARVVAEVLARHGVVVPTPPPGPGPCALADPDLVRRVLAGAGWTDVAFDAPDVTLLIGGPTTVAEAVHGTVTSGSNGLLLRDQPDAVVADVRAALTEAYTERYDGTGVRVPAGFWVITARPA